jgi:hypothetical protein
MQKFLKDGARKYHKKLHPSSPLQSPTKPIVPCLTLHVIIIVSSSIKIKKQEKHENYLNKKLDQAKIQKYLNGIIIKIK